MSFLRQSTSQVARLGKFVDATDGVTAETALTIANTDILLSKDGGAFAAKNSGGATHDSVGWYSATLDATDTATVGILEIDISVAGALPVFMRFYVVEEAVYDALFAASAAGPLTSLGTNAPAAWINAAALEADAITAAKIAPGAVAKGDQLTGLNDLDAAATRAALGLASADLDTQLDAILADTGELQTNQGNWITATGFSTHSAADVRTEMDSNSTQLAKLGTPAGVSISADIAAISAGSGNAAGIRVG